MDYLFALQTIRESAPDFINLIFVFLSEYMIVLSFFVPAVIYWTIDKAAGSTILMGYFLSYNVNQTIKNFACIYRPWVLDSRLYVDSHAVKSATGYSFPSGHTATAASIYGGISVWQKKRKVVVICMSTLILLTAFARNWLGAHTMKDVVCAIIFVAVSLSVVNIIKYWFEKNPERDTLICFGGIAVSIIILLIVSLKKYPIDYAADGSILVDPYSMTTDCFSAFGCATGGLLGWWLQRHFLNFTVEVSKKTKWVRAVSGFVISLLIYVTAGKLFAFTGVHVAHAIKYGIIFLYIFYLHPLLFTKVFERKRK